MKKRLSQLFTVKSIGHIQNSVIRHSNKIWTVFGLGKNDVSGEILQEGPSDVSRKSLVLGCQCNLFLPCENTFAWKYLLDIFPSLEISSFLKNIYHGVSTWDITCKIFWVSLKARGATTSIIISPVIRQKVKSQNERFKKTKNVKFSEKQLFFTQW